MRALPAMVALLFATVSCSGQSATQEAAPSSPAAALADARTKLQHGQSQQAIDTLQQLVAAKPPLKGAYRQLGIAYYRTGKLVEAEKAFAQAMAEDGADNKSVQLRGLSLYRLGQSAAAIPFLERARQWNSDANVDVNYVLARCFISAQRYDDARHAIAAQYGVSPESGDAYLLAAQVLVSEELPEPAAAFARMALQISPSIPLAHFLLGKILLAQGDTSGALRQLEMEKSINPGYAPVYEWLGDLYSRTGEYQQAQAALTKNLSLEQNSTGPFILMGKVFLSDGDPQTAATYLEHAEQMDPGNYVTHSLLGQAYRAMGRKDDAKREFEAVAAIHAAARQQSRTVP